MWYASIWHDRAAKGHSATTDAVRAFCFAEGSLGIHGAAIGRCLQVITTVLGCFNMVQSVGAFPLALAGVTMSYCKLLDVCQTPLLPDMTML